MSFLKVFHEIFSLVLVSVYLIDTHASDFEILVRLNCADTSERHIVERNLKHLFFCVAYERI